MNPDKYLQLLSNEYPNIQSASARIIELHAMQNLPKGSDYFFSDLHGEHRSFRHQLKSASGMIRNKIDEIYEFSVSEAERNELALLIYYPEKELNLLKEQGRISEEWIKLTISRLLKLAASLAEKYTRSNMRSKLPSVYASPVEELIHAADAGKKEYYSRVMDEVISANYADDLIRTLCNFIVDLTVDRLHIIGDIFDRGPRADLILSELEAIPNIDIQWGNHDISWIGAVAGNEALIANVIRLGISYNNFDLLEDAYGINLRPLSEFAATTYKDDPCESFIPHEYDHNQYDRVKIDLAAKMHKAISIIQFKLEGQLIARHPEYHMEDRSLLSHISSDCSSVTINGTVYPLKDTYLPTVDPKAPLELTKAEEALMHSLKASFRHSQKLNQHIRFILTKGAMYKSINNCLLYHGCVPLTSSGELLTSSILGEPLQGKALFDRIDRAIRHAVLNDAGDVSHQSNVDLCWYLWCGPESPLFGKDKMTVFEKYFLQDPSLLKENRNPYYDFCNSPAICDMILEEFGLSSNDSRIVNGHVPVKIGENPIKAGGKLFIIDGGISKAYRSTTGIAGYTLIYSSRYIALAQHKPYHFDVNGIPEDHTPAIQVVIRFPERILVHATDEGKQLDEQIQDLAALIDAYKSGILKENEA